MVLNSFGWATVNAAILPIVLMAGGALLWLALRQRAVQTA
jgi:hypothetical protein